MVHMSQSTIPFEYDNLPPADLFRYLILYPGQSDATLVCDLHTAPILDITFNALSYVWGKDERTQVIFCNEHPMTITPNLATALRGIRSQNEPLTLWADGICINQQNVKEKSHQVMRMGKIYRAAREVLIYLGSDDDGHGSTVQALLNDVDAMIQKHVTMEWKSLPYPEHDDDPILDEERWKSLYWLLSEPWFGRGWVLQEAAVARRGVMIWGGSRFDWDKLMHTCVWLSVRGVDIYNLVSFQDVDFDTHLTVYLYNHQELGRKFCGDYMYESSSSILTILNCARNLSLKDPRDRIYAFLELPGHKIDIVPDYSDSHLKAYQHFAEYYLKDTQTAEILEYVSHDELSFTTGCTWVPRWDVPRSSLSHTSSATSPLLPRSGAIKPPTVFPDVLSVHGILLDSIHYISDTFDAATITPQFLCQVWNVVRGLPVESPSGTMYGNESSKRQVQTFLQSLCCGLPSGLDSQWRRDKEAFALEAQLATTMKEDSSPSTRITSMEKNHTTSLLSALQVPVTVMEEQPTVDSTEESSSISSVSSEEEPNIYFTTVRRRTHGRRLIVTVRGYMGLAPSICSAGDDIAIIFGCLTPCVLRKSIGGLSKSTEHFMYLGATPLIGTKAQDDASEEPLFSPILGEELSKDWMDWDVQEQDIHLV